MVNIFSEIFHRFFEILVEKKLAKKYYSKSVLWPLKKGSRFDLLRFGSVALEDWEVR